MCRRGCAEFSRRVAKEVHGKAAGKRRRERTPDEEEVEEETARATTGTRGDGDGRNGVDTDKAPHFSAVDRGRLDDFPLFKRAVTVEVDLVAGDVLYLPAGWFHEARASCVVWQVKKTRQRTTLAGLVNETKLSPGRFDMPMRSGRRRVE
jgi:hypothetical protein